jgi:hypothetical protein
MDPTANREGQHTPTEMTARQASIISIVRMIM